jgi:predicted lipoprotein with Yx(FWY)xxD motif
MKRILLLLAAVAALSLPATVAASGTPANVKLAKTDHGKLLENKAGLVAMIFSLDSKNKDACQKKVGCPQAWPAITTKGKPTGGKGINAKLLGTITLTNGKKQITYNGHPLYTFGGDSPGDTSYIGQPAQGGKWYGINAAGNRVS